MLGRKGREYDAWRSKLDELKAFSESLSPYNTVGKLKNLRIGSDDIAAQKKNLEVLSSVEGLNSLIGELGNTASYLGQAELVLPSDHAWVKQAQDTRKQVLEAISLSRTLFARFKAFSWEIFMSCTLLSCFF